MYLYNTYSTPYGASHISIPEYSVVMLLLLETEFGGYRGSCFVQYMCLSVHIVGEKGEGRVGANNAQEEKKRY